MDKSKQEQERAAKKKTAEKQRPTKAIVRQGFTPQI